MNRTRPLCWLSRRPAPPRKPPGRIRPTLEVLEDRVVPDATVTSVNVSQHYGFLQLTETVNVQVTSPPPNGSGFVNCGTVNITDLNQHANNVPVDSAGNASATFKFGLFKGAQNAHSVTAQYSDSNGPFDPSSGQQDVPSSKTEAYTIAFIDIIAVYFGAGSTDLGPSYGMNPQVQSVNLPPGYGPE
jgi:hypothetical protein